MRVEFVSPYDHSPNTGIGRYIHTLTNHLSEFIDAKIRRPQFLPFAGRFPSLRNLPIGIDGHVQGSIVHFPQIMGCVMMLYRPYHPSVATVHDLGFLELPEEWEMFDPIARQMLRLSLAGLKRVDQIVTDSEFTRQGVIRHLHVPPEQVVTVHAGIDHDLFRPVPDARRELIRRYPDLFAITSMPWLLYVGSELPRKNIGALLEAVSIIRAETPDIQLVKVGAAGGTQYRRETLRGIDVLGLQKNVRVFEDVVEEELPLFYSAADVFVTASMLEGFGFPVLEAMACGTPVVCTSSGATPEIAGEGACVVNTTSPSDLAEAIKGVVEDEALHRNLVNRGFKRATMFNWQKASKSVYNGYRTL